MHSIKAFFIITVIFIFFLYSNTLAANALGKDFYLKSKNDLILNQIKKTLTTHHVFFINNKNKYSAEELIIWYQNLNNLDLEHINRIEANHNIKIETPTSILTSDKYRYSLREQAHVLLADKNPIVYKDALRTIVSHDRIEYFFNKNVIVIRGNPKMIGKENPKSLTNYYFNATLINIFLEITQTNDKNIDYIEAIDNVYFKEGDTSIKADYAIYYKKQNQIEFYNNVVFTNKESKLKSQAAIYNLTLRYGKIIPSSKNKTITGVYKTK